MRTASRINKRTAGTAVDGWLLIKKVEGLSSNHHRWEELRLDWWNRRGRVPEILNYDGPPSWCVASSTWLWNSMFVLNVNCETTHGRDHFLLKKKGLLVSWRVAGHFWKASFKIYKISKIGKLRQKVCFVRFRTRQLPLKENSIEDLLQNEHTRRWESSWGFNKWQHLDPSIYAVSYYCYESWRDKLLPQSLPLVEIAETIVRSNSSLSGWPVARTAELPSAN